MKKIVIIVVIIAATLALVIRLFTANPQSSVEELKTALAETLDEVKVLKDSNYFSFSNGERKYAEWDVSTREEPYGLRIGYHQDRDNDYYYGDEWTENFCLSLHSDGEKIIFNQYESGNFSRGGIYSFGSAYHCYREFRNADDFRKKIGKFIQDRRENMSSAKDLEIKDYYPAVSWKNFMLSFKDHDKEYKYSY